MGKPVIGVIGGTGALGQGLAISFARAGFPIVIGSRDAGKAAKTAAAIAGAEGAGNLDAARMADIVVVAVPFANQLSVLQDILPVVEGKIVVDATVCLRPPKVGIVQFPQEGSAGLIAADAIGSRARVVSAFQNVSAVALQSGEPIDGDVLVTGNDREACDVVIDLCRSIGLRGLYAGPIANSVAAEALTSILITINRQFKTHSGIRITGLDAAH